VAATTEAIPTLRKKILRFINESADFNALLLSNLPTLSLLECLQDLIDGEARGLGTRRILLEGLDEIPDLLIPTDGRNVSQAR
jgi:hypothetical protein